MAKKTEKKIPVWYKRKNPFSCNINTFHCGFIKKGEETGAGFKNLDDIKRKLQEGWVLTNCSLEVKGENAKYVVKDAEMIAIFGEENVLTKKDKDELKWKKHCERKGFIYKEKEEFEKKMQRAW